MYEFQCNCGRNIKVSNTDRVICKCGRVGEYRWVTIGKMGRYEMVFAFPII